MEWIKKQIIVEWIKKQIIVHSKFEAMFFKFVAKFKINNYNLIIMICGWQIKTFCPKAHNKWTRVDYVKMFCQKSDKMDFNNVNENFQLFAAKQTLYLLDKIIKMALVFDCFILSLQMLTLLQLIKNRCCVCKSPESARKQILHEPICVIAQNRKIQI